MGPQFSFCKSGSNLGGLVPSYHPILGRIKSSHAPELGDVSVLDILIVCFK